MAAEVGVDGRRDLEVDKALRACELKRVRRNRLKHGAPNHERAKPKRHKIPARHIPPDLRACQLARTRATATTRLGLFSANLVEARHVLVHRVRLELRPVIAQRSFNKMDRRQHGRQLHCERAATSASART